MMNKLNLLFFAMVCGISSFAQTITDGEYLIKINQTGKYFAIAGGNKENGDRAVQWDNEYTPHFKFIIKHLGNNVYTLKAKHSGKYLSTEGEPKAGAKLIQWDWLNQDNQKWFILPQNGTKGFVLSSYQNKMNVVLQYWNSTVTAGNGAYFFLQGDMNMRTMVLDFKKNETDQIQGNQIKTNVRTIATPPTDGGWYKIRVVQTGNYLGIENASNENGAKLVQGDFENRKHQQFQAKKNEDGTYSFFAAHSNKSICADKGDNREGDLIIQNTLSQYFGKWHLVWMNTCGIGWKIQYKTSSGKPLQLTGVNKGDYCRLTEPQYHDGDVDCPYIYQFEPVETPMVKEEEMKSELKPKPGVIKKNGN